MEKMAKYIPQTSNDLIENETKTWIGTRQFLCLSYIKELIFNKIAQKKGGKKKKKVSKLKQTANVHLLDHKLLTRSKLGAALS